MLFDPARRVLSTNRILSAICLQRSMPYRFTAPISPAPSPMNCRIQNCAASRNRADANRQTANGRYGGYRGYYGYGGYRAYYGYAASPDYYGYGAYPAYYQYDGHPVYYENGTSPVYYRYGGYYGDDAVLAIGAGVLGVVVGAAIT